MTTLVNSDSIVADEKMTSPRRNSYTVKFKMSVVEWQRKNQASLHRTAAEFSIDRKRVREWHDKSSVLKANECGAKKKLPRLCNGGRRPSSIDLDQKVFEFLEKERSEGRVVTNDMLRTKAVQIAGGLSIQGFKGSYGWLWRWKKHYDVGMRAGTNSAQKVPSDYHELLHSSRKSVIITRKTKNIGPPDIVNMDQTMCRFDMPFSRTNNKERKPSVLRPLVQIRKVSLLHSQQLPLV